MSSIKQTSSPSVPASTVPSETAEPAALSALTNPRSGLSKVEALPELQLGVAGKHSWLPDVCLAPQGIAQRGVLLIGGFLESSTNHHYRLAAQLQKEGCMVLTSSLFGHDGTGPVSSQFTLERVLAKVRHDHEQLRSNLPPHTPITVGGFSAGGSVALLFGSERPAAVDTILGESTYLWHSNFYTEVQSRLGSLLSNIPILHRRPCFYSVPANAHKFGTPEWYAQPECSHYPLRALKTIQECSRQAQRRIHQISAEMKVLLAVGAGDPTANNAGSKLLSEQLGARSALKVFHASGHSLINGPQSKEYCAWAVRKIRAAAI